MAEEQESKTCKMCCMAIPAKAKKCPYCHQWQYWLSMTVVHPAFILLFVLIPVVVAYGLMMTFLREPFREWEPFSQHSDQVSITESGLEFGEGEDGPIVAVVGKVKNLSPVDWKDVRFHVDFFDSKGQLFDTGQQETYSWRLPAGQETGFKVSFHRDFPEKEYASYKARVIFAVDGRRRF